MTRLRTVRKDQQGFTLIELLVVMLIIGVIAAIALPAFFDQKDDDNGQGKQDRTEQVVP